APYGGRAPVAVWVVPRGGRRSQSRGDVLGSAVDGGRGPHHRVGLDRVRAVVAADVGRLALDRDQLLCDLLLTVGELLRDGAEGGGQLGVHALLRQFLGPVHGQVEVAASVVDRAELALG